MEYRNFGRAGLKVSLLALGTSFRTRADDELHVATIQRAIDLGINVIDCSNSYLQTHAERIVGEALKGQRDRVVLTGKVCSPTGDGPNDRGLSRGHILREIERSLIRFHTDYIDIYWLHRPDPTTPLEETLWTLDDLVRQGMVRYIGCSNYAAWEVCKGLWTSDRRNLIPFSGVQNYFNLLNRSLEREMMALCRTEGLGIMAYSPLALGLFSGQFRYGQPPPPDTFLGRRPRLLEQLLTPEVGGIIETLVRIAQEREKTPAQVALAWLLSRPEVTTAVIGADTPAQVEENVGALGWELSAEERAALDAASAWACNTEPR